MVYSAFLLLFLLANLALFIYACSKVKNSGVKAEFLIRWGFCFGFFIWEDVVIVTPYNILISLVTLVLKDVRWFIIGFLVYWLIRGLGETIYYFLQQFITTKEYPHDKVLDIPFWNKFFGNISEQKYYILTQVSVEVVAALSLFFLLMLFKYWDSLALYKWL